MMKYPDSKVHGANMGPPGPRWAPCWPHELCYLGSYICTWLINRCHGDHYSRNYANSVVTKHDEYDVLMENCLKSTVTAARLFRITITIVYYRFLRCFPISNIFIYVNQFENQSNKTLRFNSFGIIIKTVISPIGE